MSDIKSFTTLATNMGSVRSDGKENITPREMATLNRMLKEMPESDRAAAGWIALLQLRIRRNL